MQRIVSYRQIIQRGACDVITCLLNIILLISLSSCIKKPISNTPETLHDYRSAQHTDTCQKFLRKISTCNLFNRVICFISLHDVSISVVQSEVFLWLFPELSKLHVSRVFIVVCATSRTAVHCGNCSSKNQHKPRTRRL